MARKDIEEKVAATMEEPGTDGESRMKRVRRYVAPKIRTLALPALQASPPCNPVSCPPDRAGCGPNVCGPIMPPPGCGPQSCNPRS